MITIEQQVSRLLDEWKIHGKILISVDYDDTLYPYRVATKRDCLQIIDLLIKAKESGAYLIIFTACNPDRHDDIKKHCEANGLAIDGINITPIDLPFGKPGSKIYYNINICDRSGINEAYEVLYQALYKYRGYLEEKKLSKLDDVA